MARQIIHDDGELQWSSALEYAREKSKNNDSRAVKVGQQGRTVKLNKEKGLCLLARDYKGFGNQEMNGVAEKYESS